MSRRFCAGAVLVVAALTAACSPSLDWERMRQQKRGAPYAASAFFADATEMRIPPAGTVTIENRSASAYTGALVSAEVIERGHHEFDVYCAVCHGRDADGQSVMASNMPGTAPPSLRTGDAVNDGPNELFDVVSHGKNRMPGYDWAMPESDRWAVVSYVRTLRPDANARTESGR